MCYIPGPARQCVEKVFFCCRVRDKTRLCKIAASKQMSQCSEAAKQEMKVNRNQIFCLFFSPSRVNL